MKTSPSPDSERRLLAFFAPCFFSLLLVLTACGGGGGSSTTQSPTPSSVDVSAIALSANSVSLAIGQTASLSASVSPSNATNKAVSWLSSNAAVASVDASGKVTAVSAGSANITASAQDRSGITSPACVVTVSAAAAITHGIQLDETNTGVPAGTTLSDINATVVVTETWITDSNGGQRFLEKKNFLSGARIEIKTGNFTVRYCKFNGQSGGSVDYGLSNVVFEYCEFDGQHLNTGGDTALGIGSLTARRLHIHRWPRAFWFGWGDLRIEECYIHDETADGGDAHLENIYIAGGANQTFIRNKLISNEVHINGDSRLMTSASLAIYNENYTVGTPYPDFPALNNIVVQDNYIESDGYYAMYCGACTGKSALYAKNMTVTGNIFGRQLHRWCGLAAPAICFDPAQPGNVWSNNTWGAPGPDTQSTDPAEGALVGAPPPQ